MATTAKRRRKPTRAARTRKAASAKAPQPDRPSMPKGYGIKPASTGQFMPWANVQRRLAASKNYWVVTTRPDGRPHVMPVWGVWVEGAFCFGTSPTSRKARNLKANARMAVHLESGDDVVILEGRAQQVTSRVFIRAIDDAYAAKYKMKVSTHPDAAVYALRPRVAFAWRERDFNKKATRWRFAG